ncbi:hypothetical protein DFH09DRAFT_1198374 [Mycena vulgaris]|nr:hypothetical protein DFH09DRAFT_1198374 [Mycena vulgaris]
MSIRQDPGYERNPKMPTIQADTIGSKSFGSDVNPSHRRTGRSPNSEMAPWALRLEAHYFASTAGFCHASRRSFTICSLEDAELVDGCPVVHLSDHARDLKVFLQALFDYRFFLPAPTRTDFDTPSVLAENTRSTRCIHAQ